jgi:hypothetical protein
VIFCPPSSRVEIDLVSIEREGSIKADEFCRKCGSPHFYLDMTKRKVKDKHGNTVEVKNDPGGLDRYWKLLWAMRTMSRKQLSKALAEWEEFISTRDKIWWYKLYLDQQDSQVAEPADEWVGQTYKARKNEKGPHPRDLSPKMMGPALVPKGFERGQHEAKQPLRGRKAKVISTREEGGQKITRYATPTRKVDTGQLDEKGKKIYREEPPKNIFCTPTIGTGSTRNKDKSGGRTAKDAIRNISVGEYVEGGFRTVRR